MPRQQHDDRRRARHRRAERSRGRLTKPAALAALAAAAGVAGTPAGRRRLRTVRHQADRKSRYFAGRVEGLRYWLRDRGPDPDVPDLVLADRIRSTLGPLERELDIPRAHVMVNDKVALLHGDVDTAEAAERIEQTVEAVPGVEAVQSYLHGGLFAGDTRPSEGRRRHPPSELLRRLTDAAGAAGAAAADERRVVRAVLSVLADRLPPGERDHLFGHLTADVKAMLEPPRRRGSVERIRIADEFVGRVAVDAGLPPDQAQRATVAIFAVLRATPQPKKSMTSPPFSPNACATSGTLPARLPPPEPTAGASVGVVDPDGQRGAQLARLVAAEAADPV